VPGSSSRGFTIVEAIIALAIVTTGVLSLVGLAHQVVDAVARSRRHLQAAVLADEYVALRYGAPLTGTATDCLERDLPGCVELLDAAGRVTTGTAAFLRRWRISPVVGAPTVTWTLSVCVVPVAARRLTSPTPGACVSRVLHEGGP
jgi:hypothetical protein